jgi:hypothetical protein
MGLMDTRARVGDPPPGSEGEDLAGLLAHVARGDHRAFEMVYTELAGPIYGMVRQVLRDPLAGRRVTRVDSRGAGSRTALAPTAAVPLLVMTLPG